ncbi:hypothetical protein [Roseateles amylovorans]|uniref:Ig-like domain-containing protein n=1 Tax=Roseateles amylovorans TaxID=2978473 RepID=A0ABY6AUQ7_9BURK|nr:hypothetical protein [Roseateles amylovorans]UXH76949.1 hypothetical protein N4261_18220 [Roseateles amylovorans]
MSSTNASTHAFILRAARSPSFAGAFHRAYGRMHAPDSRATGLLLVALIHVLIVSALVHGMRRHATPPPPPIQLHVVDQPKPPALKLDPLTPQPPPTSPTVTPRIIDAPPILIDSPLTPESPAVIPAVTPTETSVNTATVATAVDHGAGAGSGTGSTTLTKPEIVSPGVVCTAMASPTLPSVNWTGEALFRAVADVQAGRVVAVQIQTLQGQLDARTRRAFTGAIETTLKEGYLCPGNHRFQQEFSFRVD